MENEEICNEVLSYLYFLCLTINFTKLKLQYLLDYRIFEHVFFVERREASMCAKNREGFRFKKIAQLQDAHTFLLL